MDDHAGCVRIAGTILKRNEYSLEFSPRMLFDELRELIEQIIRPAHHVVHDLGGLLDERLDGAGQFIRHGVAHAAEQVGQQPDGAPPLAHFADLGQHPLHGVAIHRETELLRRRVFQVMRLVHDEVLIFRQRAIVHGNVGQQQRVIDDDDVRRFGGLARAIKETLAALKRRAAFRRAGLVIGAQPRPDRALDGVGQE